MRTNILTCGSIEHRTRTFLHPRPCNGTRSKNAYSSILVLVTELDAKFFEGHVSPIYNPSSEDPTYRFTNKFDRINTETLTYGNDRRGRRAVINFYETIQSSTRLLRTPPTPIHLNEKRNHQKEPRVNNLPHTHPCS